MSPGRAQAVARAVVDPELPMLSLHDLGVLRGVRLDGSTVIVDITPTYSGCPAMAEIRTDLAEALRAAGFARVEVRTVLSPPWSSADITAHGREVLAEHGIAGPGPVPAAARGPIRLTLAPPHAPACPQCHSPDTELLSAFGATSCKALHRCRTCREPFEAIKAV